MKLSICQLQSKFILQLALILSIFNGGEAENDAFEDCATTTFKMANNRLYLGASVIKYTKLTVGQGSLDCMSLCRSYDECWSYNYDKGKKFCYLFSDAGTTTRMRTKRRSGWGSGKRVCVAHSDNTEWNNDPIDSSSLAPSNLNTQIIVGESGTAFVASWAVPIGLKNSYYDRIQYKLICGEDNDDWHCDESALAVYSSDLQYNTFVTETDPGPFAYFAAQNATSAKCYVQVYYLGLTTACSPASILSFCPLIRACEDYNKDCTCVSPEDPSPPLEPTYELCAPDITSFTIDEGDVYGIWNLTSTPSYIGTPSSPGNECRTTGVTYKIVYKGVDLLDPVTVCDPSTSIANSSSQAHPAGNSVVNEVIGDDIVSPWGYWGWEIDAYAVAEYGGSYICSQNYIRATTPCFPASATVQALGRGTVRMDELNVGDTILAIGHQSGKLEWHEVYFFGRRQKDVMAQYQKITAQVPDTKAQVELLASGIHFVAASEDTQGWCSPQNATTRATAATIPSWASHKMVLAKDVRPSMIMWKSTGTLQGSPTPSCVISNELTLEQGAYDPYVRSRALLVDSVAASPHVRWTSLGLYWVLPAWMQPHLPAIYDVFMTPIYWLYRAVGAEAMNNLCSTFFFKGYLADKNLCRGGAFYCIGGNIMLAIYLGIAGAALHAVPSSYRRMRSIAKKNN